MLLDDYFQIYLPIIEDQLKAAVSTIDKPYLAELRYMLQYHMGWEGEGAGPDARGKRIRPILVLLTTMAAGGEWQNALPATCAVELIHNFSLIHDDIEDNSPLRRGRPTIWKKWGVAHATNAGDAMFTLAHIEIFRLIKILPSETVIKAAELLQRTCLHLTQGQYLDLAYEQRSDLTAIDYWPMISGKTGALLAACTELGSMIALAPEPICQAYRQFGYSLGLAFQAQDDFLGIWGDSALTGKSTENDLVTGKKTLPIVYGLSKQGKFFQRWSEGPITPTETIGVAHILSEEGAKEYVLSQVSQLTAEAIHALEAANPAGEAAVILRQLAKRLLTRQS